MDLLAACPGLDWAIAAAPAEVPHQLEQHQPEVVFSIKHSGFPGPAHALAARHPSVRWFHVGGAGREHLGAIREDLRVTDSAGVLAPFLAERALAALLALSTGLRGLLEYQRESRWRPTRFRSLSGRTLVSVGAGHTGTAFAEVAAPLGVRVVGVRREETAAHPPFAEMHGARALDELLPRADILSLHVRLNAETRGLVDARRLALLPEGAVVLNASRGPVLDETALLDAMGANVAGAWLDVFAEEPLPASSPLWSHPRVVVTPHCADQVDNFPRRFAERFAELWGIEGLGSAG